MDKPTKLLLVDDGAFDYCLKPVDFDELLLEKVLLPGRPAGWQERDQELLFEEGAACWAGCRSKMLVQEKPGVCC